MIAFVAGLLTGWLVLAVAAGRRELEAGRCDCPALPPVDRARDLERWNRRTISGERPRLRRRFGIIKA